jgi:hypothetical protein
MVYEFPRHSGEAMAKACSAKGSGMREIHSKRRSGQWRGVTLLILLCLTVACQRTGPLQEKAFVAPERLKLKSSTAQAARYTAELPGGAFVTVTDREESEEGILWAEIRGPEPENRVGWVENRFLIKADLVESSRRLEAEIRATSTQAIGRSKATLKLRLTPDRTAEENVITIVSSGTLLEIVRRERRSRPTTPLSSVNEGDDSVATPPVILPPDQKYDDWYLVRTPSLPVAPAGWIYGGSVNLEVPPEIVYFVSSGRRITGWHKLGTAQDQFGRPGDHYLGLEHRVFGGGRELDFDRIKILAYDPLTRNYLTPFQEDLSGRFPVTVSMLGSRGYFELTAADRSGQPRLYRYQLDLDSGGALRVTRLAPLSNRSSRR